MSRGNNNQMFFMAFIVIIIIAFVVMSSSPAAVVPPVVIPPPSADKTPTSGPEQAYAGDTYAERTYQLLANTDYGGGDLGLHVEQTIAQCQSLCDSNTSCVGFVYDTPNTQCYLKNSGINASPNPYNPNYTYYYTGSAPAGGGATKTVPLVTPTGKNIKWTGVNNKCLTVKDGINNGESNGKPIILWDCVNGHPNQQFTTDNNKIKWVNNGSITNKCINLDNGMNNHGSNGSSFILWECGGDSGDQNDTFGFYGNQIKWENVSGNNHINNVCMAVNNGMGVGGANGTEINAWSCGDDPNQRFSY